MGALIWHDWARLLALTSGACSSAFHPPEPLATVDLPSLRNRCRLGGLVGLGLPQVLLGLCGWTSRTAWHRVSRRAFDLTDEFREKLTFVRPFACAQPGASGCTLREDHCRAAGPSDRQHRASNPCISRSKLTSPKNRSTASSLSRSSGRSRSLRSSKCTGQSSSGSGCTFGRLSLQVRPATFRIASSSAQD